MKLYVEIGLPHTEFIPKKKLVDPPRLLPDYSKMSAKYAGFETMSQFEIDELCSRLSRPKSTYVQRDQLSDEAIKFNEYKPKTSAAQVEASRFTGRRKLSSKAMQSLVDRLSNPSSRASARESASVEFKDKSISKSANVRRTVHRTDDKKLIH